MHDRAARLAWFKSVVLPHEAALRRHVRRLTGHGIDLDDVVAEALVRAYGASDYQRIDRGRSFLFAIARNLLTDIARRSAVVSFDLVANLEALDLADQAPSTEAIVSGRDELRHLQQLVDALPPQPRRVFVLRRIDELSLKEIASQMRLSVSTVEKHLAKAMALLAQGMAEADGIVDANRGIVWDSVTEKR